MQSQEIDFSIVMPCLNEERTIGICIDKVHRFFASTPYSYEIVVADNLSTDHSRDIASALGARVVEVQAKGYGNALRHGIEHCKGRYIIMGDADDSYNFLKLEGFVEKLQEGYDLVMGNRFKGGIMKGAMPWMNRYIGNPLLSGIAKRLFCNKIGDYHCGLRAFTADCYTELTPVSTGMEFASELPVLAYMKGKHITEVPIVLYPDGRNRKPHLNPWKDGIRHLYVLWTLFKTKTILKRKAI